MSANDKSQQAFLTFRLADQFYALPIENVLEVVAMMTVSKIPNTPDPVLGLVNRHGDAVTMLDLRLAFEFNATPPDVSTLFIVAQDESYLVGLVVDEILQVRYVDITDVKPVQGAGRFVNHFIRVGQDLYQQINLNALYNDYLAIIHS